MEKRENRVERKETILEILLIGIILILLLPVIILGGIFLLIIKNTDRQKCKYWKECPWYDKKNLTCTQESGSYSFDKPAGCYIAMEETRRKNGKSF